MELEQTDADPVFITNTKQICRGSQRETAWCWSCESSQHVSGSPAVSHKLHSSSDGAAELVQMWLTTTMVAPEDVSVAAVAKEHHEGFSPSVYWLVEVSLVIDSWSNLLLRVFCFYFRPTFCLWSLYCYCRGLTSHFSHFLFYFEVLSSCVIFAFLFPPFVCFPSLCFPASLLFQRFFGLYHLVFLFF